RKGSNIKSILLDQTILSGIGNIYADESLWGAMIHPSSLVVDIPKTKLKKLHSEIIYVLNLSIDKGGSTSRNYVNAEGKKGSYLEFAKVFRRENLPCPRCGTIIEKIRVAGRGTHFCPKCQTLNKTRNSKH
ncbi:DNA-formamidopyrimidine glycosylase, partial [Candidatus Saccharibacteria bacterium]|nr:DNA-formamidopyrimidine glycosylase [Candidatus Saccharibacteria bacterium]